MEMLVVMLVGKRIDERFRLRRLFRELDVGGTLSPPSKLDRIVCRGSSKWAASAYVACNLIFGLLWNCYERRSPRADESITQGDSYRAGILPLIEGSRETYRCFLFRNRFPRR